MVDLVVRLHIEICVGLVIKPPEKEGIRGDQANSDLIEETLP